MNGKVHVMINDEFIEEFTVADGVLTIPNNTRGIDIKRIAITENDSGIRDINKLIIESDFIHIGAEDFSSLVNLKELIIKGSLRANGSYTFMYIKDSIEYIYIGKLIEDFSRNSTFGLFSDMRKLKRVEFGIQPIIYDTAMFKGCVNLNANNLFKEGLLSINTEAFAGCNTLDKVNLPKSLNRLCTNAFKKCNNLKSIEFNSVCDVYKDYKAWLKNVEVICPYNFPNKYVKRLFIGSKLKIKEPYVNRIDLESKYLKAKLLGIKASFGDIPIDKHTHIGNIRFIDKKVWKEGIIDLLINCIMSRLELHSKIISDGFVGLYLVITINAYNYDKYRNKLEKYNIYKNSIQSRLEDAIISELNRFIEGRDITYSGLKDFVINNMRVVDGIIGIELGDNVFLVDSRKETALKVMNNTNTITYINSHFIFNSRLKDIDITYNKDGSISINNDCGIGVF